MGQERRERIWKSVNSMTETGMKMEEEGQDVDQISNAVAAANVGHVALSLLEVAEELSRIANALSVRQ